MKKINFLLFFSLCYFLTQAQISFVRTDMPSIGWINPEQEDTTRNAVAAISFGSRGTNQVYNFSSLHEELLDSVYYLAQTNSQNTAVPNANVAVYIPPTTYLFGLDTTSFFAYTGLQAVVSGVTVISKYTQPDTNYKFPLVYGQTFHGNYGGSVKLNAGAINSALTSFPFNWDSIKVVITAGYTDTIDGWGTVTTPVGTYNCLRQKRVEHDTTTYYYNTSNGGAYSQMATSYFGTTVLAANPAYSVATSYAYLAKETKGPVISFTYDSISQPITANWSALPPFPAAKFTADTGAAGLVTFLDSSSNASSYSWNFGDGSAANTTAAPSHTYSANGTYYVCLTVTNASGNSTICDSVHVSNVVSGSPPVAQITPAGPDTICPGASIVLRAQTGAGYTFKWSNNATADSIIVNSSGSYTVKVYHSGDSATSAPTVVVVNAANAALTLTGPATFCSGDSSLISAPAGETYLWSNSATTQSIEAKTTGSYTVTVTNRNGCTAISSPQAITVNTPQTDVITQSGLVLTSQTESTYLWYDGSTPLTTATTATYTATQNGTYSVHYTDANGCAGVSNSINITGVGINEISPSDYRIFPNPASDQIQLDLSHIDQATMNSLSEIAIYDLLGNKLKAVSISQASISVKDLSNGMYLIAVLDKNQNRKVLGKFDVVK